MAAAAIIPAYNEAATIGEVIDVASKSELIDEVLVVVDRSDDGTDRVASEHGARVLRVPTRGKGQAMAAGVAATAADTVLFLDADLLGLRTDHVDRLVRAVSVDGAGMACGLFDRGRWLNPLFLHALPILTGERAVRRDLFDELTPDEIRGYRIEAALNAHVAERGERIVSFVCDGMWHRTKEEKFSTPLEGFARKVAMLLVAMWSYVAYWAGRRLLRLWRRRRQRR